jgi:hypothetical protein
LRFLLQALRLHAGEGVDQPVERLGLR